MLAIGLLAAPATASEVERVAIVYEASGACPSEPDFLATVRRYTARWERVPAGTEATRTFRVRVHGDPAGATGTLAVERAGGAISQREIAGPDCAVVSEALAVMVAGAVAPRKDASGADEEGGRPGDVAPVAPALSPAPQRARPKLPEESRRARGAFAVAIDLRGEATSAVVSAPLFLLALTAKLELAETTGPRWLQALRPSVGIGLRQSLPKEHTLRGGSVTFLWTTGHLRVCPFRIALGPSAEVSPCLEGNAGRLGAAAEGYAAARTLSRLWLDLGGSVSATVNVSPRFFLSGHVLVTAPFTRQEFVLASGASASAAPAVGVLGGVGLGVRL